MIKNEREYKITKASVKRFEKSLVHITTLTKDSKIEPAKLKLQEAANKSILAELRKQLIEYDKLKAGKFELSKLNELEAIPDNLIKARVALGWTQKDLAKRLKTTEQQIQKYEANNYKSASLSRIIEIIGIFKQEHKHA
jgi:ribosome-binding protein aMBF1 (putative translation factor)